MPAVKAIKESSLTTAQFLVVLCTPVLLVESYLVIVNATTASPPPHHHGLITTTSPPQPPPPHHRLLTTHHRLTTTTVPQVEFEQTTMSVLYAGALVFFVYVGLGMLCATSLNRKGMQKVRECSWRCFPFSATLPSPTHFVATRPPAHRPTRPPLSYSPSTHLPPCHHSDHARSSPRRRHRHARLLGLLRHLQRQPHSRQLWCHARGRQRAGE